MKTVDVYVRTSVDRTGEGLTVNAQLASVREFCAEKGWEVGEVFTDNDRSAMGKGKVRPAFERLLNRTVHRDVVAHNWDRFIRVSADVERVLSLENVMSVYFVEVGEIDLSTAYGRALARILTAMATAEIENKQVRTLLANRARAEAGLPYWPRKVTGHHRDGSADALEAPLVVKAVTDLIAGKSLAAVAREWNDAGLANYHGKAWTPQGVRHVVTNRRICGELIYKGEVMPVSKIEPLISRDTFYELQGVLSAPQRHVSGFTGRKPSTLLSGIAKCGKCDDGTTMHAGTVAMAGGRQPGYVCPKRHNMHPREFMDEAMESHVLSALYRNPIALDDGSNTAASSAVQRIRGELLEWEKIASQIGAQEYLRVTKPLREQLEEAEQVAQNQSLADLFEGLDISTLGAVRQWWDLLPLDKKRGIVTHLFKNVVMRHKGRRDDIDRFDCLIVS